MLSFAFIDRYSCNSKSSYYYYFIYYIKLWRMGNRQDRLKA